MHLVSMHMLMGIGTKFPRPLPSVVAVGLRKDIHHGPPLRPVDLPADSHAGKSTVECKPGKNGLSMAFTALGLVTTCPSSI